MLLRQCETWSQGDFSVVTGFSGLQWKLAESGVCVRKLQISHYFQQSQGFWNSKFSLTKYFTCWDACKCTFNPNLIVLQNDFIFVSDLDLTLPSFFIVEYHLRKKSSFLCLHIILDIQCSYLLWGFFGNNCNIFTSLSFHMQGVWSLVSFLYSVQNWSVQHNWTVKV